jgi:oligopeptide transport system ATP-binding protein
VPRLDGDSSQRLVPIEGSPPDLTRLPPGCAFAPRCRLATDECRQVRPELRTVGTDHIMACIRDAAAVSPARSEPVNP